MGVKRRLGLLAPAVAAVLLVSACGGGSGGQLRSLNQEKRGVNDINAQPDSNIQDGGTLKWPMDTWIDNWNYNEVDGTTDDETRVQNTMMPWPFTEAADASVNINHDYLDSAQLVSTNPQVVEYKINPKAKWSNGRQFSWEDFKAQWQALNNSNPAFQVSQTAGYTSIGNVERGADDQDVKVTFAKPFGEWKSIFVPLFPKELNSSPDEFNKGWVDTPKITAGPFKIGKIDLTAKTVEVVRDPNWWGKKPHLDSILFKVLDRATWPDAMASGALDVADTNALLDAVTRYKTMPNVTLHQAIAPDTAHLTTNGADGRVLADQKVRLAVLGAVDRQSIANAEIGKITPNPPTLGNHMFAVGSAQYQDNASIKFNQDQSKKDLDAAGWKMRGQYRVKDGKELDLTYVSSSTPASNDVGKLLQQQLAAVGVKLTVNAVPTTDFFKNYINVSNFDLTYFRWLATSYPLSGAQGIYELDLNDPKDVQQNYGHVGSKQINDLYEQALAELDDGKRAQMTQQIDKLLWAIGGELPIYQLPGAVATKKNVANYGAVGFARNPLDYIDIGFTKS
jgi:glutathione transport system substrate-binding protein